MHRKCFWIKDLPINHDSSMRCALCQGYTWRLAPVCNGVNHLLSCHPYNRNIKYLLAASFNLTKFTKDYFFKK